MSSLQAKSIVSAVISSVIAAALTAAFDWFIGRQADLFVFSTLENIPPTLAPLWLALPRTLFFLIIGFLFRRWTRGNLLIAATFYLALIGLYFYELRFGGGFWTADNTLAYLIAYLPFAVIPIAFLIGLAISPRNRHLSNATPDLM